MSFTEIEMEHDGAWMQLCEEKYLPQHECVCAYHHNEETKLVESTPEDHAEVKKRMAGIIYDMETGQVYERPRKKGPVEQKIADMLEASRAKVEELEADILALQHRMEIEDIEDMRKRYQGRVLALEDVLQFIEGLNI